MTEFIHGIKQSDSDNVFPQLELTTATVGAIVGEAKDGTGTPALAFAGPHAGRRLRSG